MHGKTCRNKYTGTGTGTGAGRAAQAQAGAGNPKFALFARRGRPGPATRSRANGDGTVSKCRENAGWLREDGLVAGRWAGFGKMGHAVGAGFPEPASGADPSSVGCGRPFTRADSDCTRAGPRKLPYQALTRFHKTAGAHARLPLCAQAASSLSRTYPARANCSGGAQHNARARARTHRHTLRMYVRTHAHDIQPHTHKPR